MHKTPYSQPRMDGWIDDLQFYILFNNVSIISGQWENDNERLCSVKHCLRSKRFLPSAGLEPGTARSAGQRLTY